MPFNQSQIARRFDKTIADAQRTNYRIATNNRGEITYILENNRLYHTESTSRDPINDIALNNGKFLHQVEAKAKVEAYNLGAGAEVFKQFISDSFEYRTLRAVNDIIISQLNDEITIDAIIPILDGLNLGAGAKVFKQKNVNTFEYRTLTGLNKIQLTETDNEIIIELLPIEADDIATINTPLPNKQLTVASNGIDLLWEDDIIKNTNVVFEEDLVFDLDTSYQNHVALTNIDFTFNRADKDQVKKFFLIDNSADIEINFSIDFVLLSTLPVSGGGGYQAYIEMMYNQSLGKVITKIDII